ncbi:phage BR0599 family protein [Labrenzia sp. R4_1]|nr:phage BR0599 family protein [Labrenzia sp. R4_1]
MISCSGIGKRSFKCRICRPSFLPLRTACSLSPIDLTVWLRPVNAIQPGDAFTVRAGCPHTFSACQSKFSNGVNFRGFPHMPGNDFVLGYAVTGETDNDGSAIVG